MRKLPWHEADLKSYLICCMVNIWNVKYNSIHCVANLLAGLVAYQEDVGIHVVDGVLEDIRLGMEVSCGCWCELEPSPHVSLVSTALPVWIYRLIVKFISR